MSNAVRVIDKCGKAALTAPPRLVVGTIHSVKGGESDVVYMFPDVSRSGAYQLETRANRLEVKRQFYVAMSRAKETLVVCLLSLETW